MFERGRKPKLKAGESARVKSFGDIVTSLDPTGRLDGCLFTEQMKGYCGSRYAVLKTVRAFFNEHRQRTFRARVPLYILEGVICDGKTSEFSHECDHSCFLLWHENWLEKVE